MKEVIKRLQLYVLEEMEEICHQRLQLQIREVRMMAYFAALMRLSEEADLDPNELIDELQEEPGSKRARRDAVALRLWAIRETLKREAPNS